MERNEVFEKMMEICKDVFDDDKLVVTEATTAADVEGWDSLTHLSLVNELEETFEVAFTLDEVTGSKNLGELLNALMKHIAEK
ncbi:acyl carrier protein [Lachnospiraceae bacterium KHCPX20]|nr:acyl carrier protein [Lachnospiraceae bacterium KHCPX20]